MKSYRPFAPEYLPGDDAAAYLGLQRNKFQRAVVMGNIRRYHPHKSKRGYFALRELQHLKTLSFDWADAEAVRAAYQTVLAGLVRESD